MKKHFSFCIASCGLAIISEILVVFNSVILGNIIDTASQGKIDSMFRGSIELILILIGNNIIFTLSVYYNLKFANVRTVDLRKAIVKNLFIKPIDQVKKEEDAYYVNMIYGDIDKLNDSYFQNYSIEWKFLSLYVVSLIMIAKINAILFFIAIVFSILPIIVTVILQKTVQRQGERCSKSDEIFQSRLSQLIQGYDCVKLNADSENYVKSFFQPVVYEKGNSYVKKESTQTIAYSLVDFVNSFGQLLVIICGGFMIVSGKISTGELVSCIMLSSYLYSGINNFLETFLERKAYGKVYRKVENAANTIECEKGTNEINIIHGCSLKYSDVGLNIDGKNIISHFTYQFENGKFYAVVGSSGIGKTSLFKMLLGYYPDYSGEILVGNVNIRNYSSESIYLKVGYMSQEEFFFNDTIENNITLLEEGRDISDELIRKSRLTSLEHRMTNGTIGDFGEKLSGGEKQRVALARILARNPEVVIFDEPTTGLDDENSKEIIDTIFELKNVICIVITHDESISNDRRFADVIRLK